MSEKYSFLVVKYPQKETADAALDVVRSLAKDKVVKLKDAVAITKTEKGKIKIHQTQDDTAGKGFLKGGLIGILFAALFGPAGWIAAGALLGTAFAMFDRGVKNKLLKELGENMTPDESAIALLIERADWQTAFDHMQWYEFHGEVVISEIVEEDMAEVEKLLEDARTAATVPEEMDMPAPVIAAALDTAPAPVEVIDEGSTTVVKSEEGVAIIEEPEAPAIHRKTKLDDLEGIGAVYSEKLAAIGVKTVEDLLEKGCTTKGRKEIGDATGISDKLILRWVNMADLYRIKGIGQEYAELLEAAGVDTVPELAQRAPANLLAKMEAANEHRKMVRRLPVLSQVESWVEQAKNLERVVTY